ncbi:hypothetical protein RIR_jg209.t1 [Rhizophagus irregularis DAOM 181602=DAOM 197198]|nr:hypothetical protein RIR_jg209.t1 [Rhizophagus irregularis DAOM 181602=DAOM 197198]
MIGFAVFRFCCVLTIRCPTYVWNDWNVPISLAAESYEPRVSQKTGLQMASLTEIKMMNKVALIKPPLRRTYKYEIDLGERKHLVNPSYP